ncbi:MAG: HD domain-containing protein [Anaerolineae bacterium]|nr:HD domain-containing protein [Anaerolineae bacterium]
MLRLPTEMLQPGMILAKPVINERGQVLLRHNVPLTPDYINVLKRKGFASVFVKDRDTEDIVAEDVLSQEIRQTAQAALVQVFDFVQQVSADFNQTNGKTVIAGLGDATVTNALRSHDGFKQLEQMVVTILDNLLDTNLLNSITQIRNHNDVLFSHSINVTATALMIGKRLHLNRRDLEQLGAGCMLHDIGKVFLDQTATTGPSTTLAQRHSLLREHPRLGYELLRTRNPDAVLVNHVALEHHERQDGLGYPRNLRGTNKIDRPMQDAQNIKLIAEIAAVADVYDMLNTHRPNRPALTPPQISDTMRRMTGTFLNREITEHFLSLLTILPVGLGVIVQGGRYVGYKGVIVKVNHKQPYRPLIRLLYNSQGGRILPIELDLARELSMSVEATLAL